MDEDTRRLFTAELNARLNAEIDRLAAKHGVTREKIMEFTQEFLSRAGKDKKMDDQT